MYASVTAVATALSALMVALPALAVSLDFYSASGCAGTSYLGRVDAFDDASYNCTSSKSVWISDNAANNKFSITSGGSGSYAGVGCYSFASCSYFQVSGLPVACREC
jgi:hypothetical protein